MMSEAANIIERDAIGWVIRLRDPGFAGWEDFTAWLEADPDHARIYQEIATADEDVAEWLSEAPPPVLVPTAPTARRDPTRRWAMAAVASALLVAVTSYAVLSTGASPYAVETGPGARRSVTLADGSRIDLNGATRLILDRDEPRFAKLERGEAYFTVVHDEANPFIVETGGAELRDVGTAFNVVRSEGVTEVAVSEGAVVYNPQAERVLLPAGKALRVADADPNIQVSDASPASVASWRRGRLIYTGAPLAAIAADLSRNLGVKVRADPKVAAIPFNGVILLDADPERVLRRVATLIGVEARRGKDGWLLTSAGHAPR